MHVTLVHVQVRPDCVQDFIEATRANHEASVREPGNLRFDVLQSPEDATRFIFYEAYRTPADAAAHKETPHYKTWRDRVADWMAAPRRGVPMNGLLPAADAS
jgi:(4S)-4-hydroxy-5-phosphonooxypentane-2,3-dione isomerase